MKNTYYLDYDHDGFGHADTTLEACSAPGGYTENNGDCDDEDAATYPGAEEICIGADTDCDGTPDNGCWVYIYAGSFEMGSPSDEVGREDNESQHWVTLSRDFELGVHEVTQSEFERVMGWDASEAYGCTYGCGADNPVYGVSWYDGVGYANALSALAGLSPCYEFTGTLICNDGEAEVPPSSDGSGDYCKAHGGIDSATVSIEGADTVYACEGYRLPTEAEWEYGARAGTETAYYNGGNLNSGDENNCSGNLELDNGAFLDDMAWYCGNSGKNGFAYGTKEVGQLEANAWDLYDMSGNVREWCNDWYDDDYGVVDPDQEVTDPLGDITGSTRVLRGGSWDSYPRYVRSASRYGSTPGIRHYNFGFRVVRSAF